MTNTKKLLKLSTIMLASIMVGMTSIPAHALQNSQSIMVPMSVDLQTDAECTNSPGPIITLSGIVAVGEVNAELIFRNNNNPPNPHENVQEITASATLISDETIVIPKQPSRGGTGGNPFIWVQLTDGNGNPVTGEIFLGRCVQGLDDISTAVLVPASVLLDMSAECSNKTDIITFEGGEITLGGLTANIIFRNNDNPVGGPHENIQQTTSSVVLVPFGETIIIPKQPVLGGVGGNPFISIRFVDENGNAISEETFLGRCVQDF